MWTITFITIGILIIIGTREYEKKCYNKGICPHCGSPLKLFDLDSQGGRGYKCISCHYVTWCSYNVDKYK